MTRYLLDKFVYEVDADPDLLDRYLEDPAGFVAWWERERADRVTEREVARGHTFTDDERAALVELDIRSLFAAGVHPFLLFTWVLPILEGRFDTFPEVLRAYGEAIAGLGQVGWRT